MKSLQNNHFDYVCNLTCLLYSFSIFAPRVNVKHDIIVEIQNDIAGEDEYNEVFEQVQEALTTVQNCSLGNGKLS